MVQVLCRLHDELSKQGHAVHQCEPWITFFSWRTRSNLSDSVWFYPWRVGSPDDCQNSGGRRRYFLHGIPKLRSTINFQDLDHTFHRDVNSAALLRETTNPRLAHCGVRLAVRIIPRSVLRY